MHTPGRELWEHRDSHVWFFAVCQVLPQHSWHQETQAAPGRGSPPVTALSVLLVTSLEAGSVSHLEPEAQED